MNTRVAQPHPDPHPDIDIRHACADDAAGIAGLFDRVYRGGYHLADCTDPELIRATLIGGEHIWMLALAGRDVIGSVMARRDAGHGRYELCRAAIDQRYQGRADVGDALDALLRDTIQRPDCDLLYGNVRSLRALRKFARGQAMGWSWTGADGGMHVVAGEREEHLFGMAFNPERTVTRILPHRSVLLAGSAVAREAAQLNSVTRTGEYPMRISAPGPGEHTHESERGRVSYSLFEPSRAALITAVEGDTPGDVRRLLLEIIDGAAPSKVEHLTLHALADKVAVIEELCRPEPDEPTRRFAVHGYLPGWHGDGEARYDCVTLVTQVSEQIPNRFGLDPHIENVYRSFMAGPTRRP